ncbi:ThuA domain-containing protein [Paenibacillus sp. PL91]|uniref:ThuA domain-containing protein n=1 Tax=Paenibacillus sp. PL91 TaxID=2729538 RepID=UPI00145F8B7E|nr:ThuA domain-containing protein [Paenibacillus sp. PL91]MBC9203011.1 ThuA domain-containing protein [Paenibacillus sp. PL91]
MKVGVICNDCWHPGKTIVAGLEPLSKQGIEFDYIQHASEWSSKWMEQQDVIVLAKANHTSASDKTPWLTDDIQQQFQSYVEHGKGLLVLHAGTVGYRNEPVFFELVGGVFQHHPEAGPVTMAYTNNTLWGSANTDVFAVHDEHYHMEVNEERIQIFMTSKSEHSTQPAGWLREQGTGRVCVLTPGHFLQVFQQPEYQTIITQALQWCAGGKQ